MKILLLLGGLLAGRGAVGAAAQVPILPIDSASHKITYSAVVAVPGASQAELYGRALRWLASAVPHAATDPVIKDPASGTLVARMGLHFTGRAVVGTMPYTLWRQASIRVKEGRAKYEFSDFELQPYVTSAGAAVSTL